MAFCSKDESPSGKNGFGVEYPESMNRLPRPAARISSLAEFENRSFCLDRNVKKSFCFLKSSKSSGVPHWKNLSISKFLMIFPDEIIFLKVKLE